MILSPQKSWVVLNQLYQHF